MGSQSWRKAYGALKDSTTVSLAKINSDYKDLDVAILKATNHVEKPPKERHIQRILAATSPEKPRDIVVYCVQALARRLQRTHTWTVALKTLMIIHRMLRGGAPAFKEELLHFSQKRQFFQISNFKDDSSPSAWDCSAWVRTYGVFLEERLECFRTLKYDIETEYLLKSPEGSNEGHGRSKFLGSDELLRQLPALQQLLFRLICCKPEGAASSCFPILFALVMVLKESFKIYCAINDGVIKLVDVFFEMSRHDAIKGLDIYKKAGRQAKELSEFYGYCKGLELARTFQFPTLKEPPAIFVVTMEEYIQEAPRIGSVQDKCMECSKANSIPFEQEKKTPIQNIQVSLEPEKEQEKQTRESFEPGESDGNVTILEMTTQAFPNDLLCIDSLHPTETEQGDNNALAWDILHDAMPGNKLEPSILDESLEPGMSEWELALVSAQSQNDIHLMENKLAGGFDMLVLDSLYDNATTYTSQQATEGRGHSMFPNPFEVPDPFSPSIAFSPPSVQMAMMVQQQNAATMPSYQHSFLHVEVVKGAGDTCIDPGILNGIPGEGSTNLL